MKYLLTAAAVIAALYGALWFLVMRDTSPPSTAHPAAETATKAPEPDEVAPPPVVNPNVHARTSTIPTAPRRPAEHTAPTALPTEPPRDAGELIEAAPADPLRAALNDQAKATEGAVLDCIDASKKAGTLVDGVAAFGFRVEKHDQKVELTGSTVEYTPWDETLSACIRNSAAGMVFESLPGGASNVLGFRKVEIANGELKRNVVAGYEK